MENKESKKKPFFDEKKYIKDGIKIMVKIQPNFELQRGNYTNIVLPFVNENKKSEETKTQLTLEL